MKILFGGLLAISLALNFFLWSRLSSQSNQLKLAQASVVEIDELRRQNHELQVNRTSASDFASADVLELARLRNEVAQLRNEARQLRKQAGEEATWREQAAEAVQLRARLDAATQELIRAESALADAVKFSPEELQQAKAEAQSVQCINHLKQIGLAARMWANDHNNVFPPDFISMKDELATPKILFCPAAAVRVTDWSRLNPSLITYRFLNPNGHEHDPAKVLTTCPIHGHVGLSDGSVHRR